MKERASKKTETKSESVNSFYTRIGQVWKIVAGVWSVVTRALTQNPLTQAIRDRVAEDERLRFLNSLVFRIIAPIIVLTLILGLGVLLFVRSSVENFASDHITDQVERAALDMHMICEEGYSELSAYGVGKVVNSQMGEYIAQVTAIEGIEVYMRQRHFIGAVYARGSGQHLGGIYLTEPLEKMVSLIPKEDTVVFLDFGLKHYGATRFSFGPWRWQVVLLKDQDDYAGLIEGIRAILVTVGLMLLAVVLAMGVLLFRQVRGPLEAIIDPIRVGEEPNYEGIQEFEFLSDSVSQMMRSEREKAEALAEARDKIAREEQARQASKEEAQLLEITQALSSELNLVPLLVKIMDTTKELLTADRCTLFMYDEKTNELWSQIAHGLDTEEIRFPAHLGLAGSSFTTGDTINIPDAYQDDRFNPQVDKETGYHTQSILCLPVHNKSGQAIGVTQVLNKFGGPFTATDERRLKAFSAQTSQAIENAKLFDDVLNMKNYNESMLESMSNGVISLDAEKKIVKTNSAFSHIIGQESDDLIDSPAAEYFSGPNQWVMDAVDKVMETGVENITMDTELVLASGAEVSINLTIVPLINVKNELIGSLLVMEDITSEKRLKGTMARYMTKEVADKLLESGEAALGGQAHEATVFFSDIRSFTSISEKIGPQETVTMLNEYFTIMVDTIFRYQGILDKYIGDAIMAVFGAPFSTGEDPDRAVKAAIDMMVALKGFNEKRVAEAKDPINIGIGISTDEILSGNIGCLKRMDYTVIGDGVNLASRLEGANKFYGTNILISENTYKGLQGRFFSRKVDLIRVKGKTKPVGIYQILDYHDEESFPRMTEVIDLFQEGVNLYSHREWDRGIEAFGQILEFNTTDATARLYLDRCEYYKKTPPEDNWDGVWIMETK